MVTRRKRLGATSAARAASAPAVNGTAELNRHAVLLEFRHGLGDLVQLSIVLRHLRAVSADRAIDVVCDSARAFGASGFERQRFGFADPRYHRDSYEQVISIGFEDCMDDVAGFPSTKAYRCVRDVFHLAPVPELFTYAVEIGVPARRRAAEYLGQICGGRDACAGRFPVVLIHYHGFSSRMQKDLATAHVAELVRAARSRNRTVAIFDLDRQCPLVDQHTVFSPLKGHPVWQLPGDADPETMAALIDQAELFIGIDSGPLHLAGATRTPTLGVWTHHHPIRFFDFAANVLHLVPPNHSRMTLGPASLETFRTHYRHSVYGNVCNAMVEEAEKIMVDPVEPIRAESLPIPGLVAKGYTEAYYVEHLNGGLDYLGHGDWQRRYGRWLRDTLCWEGKRVLDVGCACGSILRGLGEAGLIVQGVDVSEYLVDLGRQKWPDMAELMHIADAVNLHMFADGEWEGLHSAQVAEHWRPELVPFILRELGRVTKPGSLFFASFDTSELYERNGRKPETEDPTHVCIKPLAWWHEQLDLAGWEVVTGDFVAKLKDHPEGFLSQYDWDIFVARRRAARE